MITRREFLEAAGAASLLVWAGPRRLRASGSTRRPEHPKPRPGIDASKIVPNGELKNADAVPAFDDARLVPQILDGIRCHCGCAEWKDKYSLLSCFEGDAMAQHCEICQGQARLARRMVRMRKTLDQIRTAIDAKYDK